MSAFSIHQTAIDYGPTVVSRPIPHAQSVALGVFIQVGSRDETAEQAGITHALEHMLFKGTESLPVDELSQLLDQLGGHANAFTSRERTCFHTQVLHEDSEQALGVLLDMMLKPALPEEEWQREREVIFAEMGMVEDNPDEWFYDRHLQAVYAEQALGQATLGTKEVLASLSAQDLRQYLETHYRPPKLLIAAAGNVDHAKLVELVEQRTWGQAAVHQARTTARFHVGKQFLERDMEQVQIVASYPCIHSTSQERPLAWLANQMLGGGMSSQLFREIRERRGLAYSVSSHLSPFQDTGLWSISCDTHPTMLSDCLPLLQEQIAHFANTLDTSLLHRAKRQMEVQFRMGMDSIEGNMMYLGNLLEEQELYSQQQWIQQIQRVEVDELQAWVRQYLAHEVHWSVAGSAEALSCAQRLL